MTEKNDVNRSRTENSTIRNASFDDTIDLVELLFRLLDGWKYIILATILGGLLAGAVTVFVMKPVYSATSTIYVLGNKDSVINMSDLQIGSALTNDYVQVFNMWEVHEQVISQLNLPYSYSQIKKMLSVSNKTNTRMIDIKVTSESAEEAARISNAYAEVVSNYISENMAVEKPSIMSKALVPSVPTAPVLSKNVALGSVLGFVLALGTITVLFILDDKIKTADDISKYSGLVNLASIPAHEKTKGEKRRG